MQPRPDARCRLVVANSEHAGLDTLKLGVQSIEEQRGNFKMPGNPREIITMAERRFPVRIRIGVPPGGFGRRHAEMTAWLCQLHIPLVSKAGGS